ncbi:MAG: thioredoxin family protein [Flavisolibacter sp.]|nr:thioredoxin family protein [Flavisolibacter sp.]
MHPHKYVYHIKIYVPEVVTKYGLITFFDYNEALETARRLKRPLMLDFTGINCVNCRKMEGQVWSDPQVMQRLKEDFVVVSLYVDVHHIDLQENEQYYSDALGKKVVTLGDKYADLQVTRFSANVQPYYFFLDGREQRLLPEGYGYDPDIRKFINLLEKAKEEYKRRSA